MEENQPPGTKTLMYTSAMVDFPANNNNEKKLHFLQQLEKNKNTKEAYIDGLKSMGKKRYSQILLSHFLCKIILFL